jgi:hypothetical protein
LVDHDIHPSGVADRSRSDLSPGTRGWSRIVCQTPLSRSFNVEVFTKAPCARTVVRPTRVTETTQHIGSVAHCQRRTTYAQGQNGEHLRHPADGIALTSVSHVDTPLTSVLYC